jgi:hypothetical protein
MNSATMLMTSHNTEGVRPHLVLISSKWYDASYVPADSDTYEMSPAILTRFQDAVRKTASDGNPIVCVPYQWNTSPVQLITKIKLAMQEHAGNPNGTVRALSLGLLAHHSQGSVFVTKHQLTSVTTLALENDRKSDQVQEFWYGACFCVFIIVCVCHLDIKPVGFKPACSCSILRNHPIMLSQDGNKTSLLTIQFILLPPNQYIAFCLNTVKATNGRSSYCSSP